MDRLSKYVIKHSSCCMPRCEYVENDIEMDCDRCQKIMLEEHDKQIIREFAEWLSNKGYLSFIEYDEDEDFEGNMTLDVREECLDVDEVISEWKKGAE